MRNPGAAAVFATRGVIAQYLDEHPEASDNLIGVTRWWLGKEADPVTLATVETAIETLIDLGMMERQALPDGGWIFRKAGENSNATDISIMKARRS